MEFQKASFIKKIINLKKIKLNYEEINYQNNNYSIKRPKNMIMSVNKFEKSFKLNYQLQMKKFIR